MSYKNKIVISLGGSLLSTPDGLNIDFIKDFNFFIRNRLKKHPDDQIFIIVGGGKIAATYRKAGRDIVAHELTYDDLDWLGVHVTRLNAHLIRTIFRDIAHPYVLKHYEIIRKVEESVVIAAGWKPGLSTDFCATLICEDYETGTIINLTNVSNVFDYDPKKYKKAKPLSDISWEDFQNLVGDTWVPETHSPFDPLASKRAQELGLKVVVLKGDDFKNIENYLAGKKFIGTVIEGK